MKNEKDYIYEYSDLNLFQIRVKLLTGNYKDVIIEFGSSFLTYSEGIQDFTFTYTLYAKPDNLNNIKLMGSNKFETHLQKVLLNIIQDKKKDKKEHSKLMKAASKEGTTSNIKIDTIFYNLQTT
jgi:hypothetical protein